MTLSLGFLFTYTLICFVGTFIGLYGVFKKAGIKHAWLVFVPVVNLYFWLKVLQRPMWWFVFLAIPYISVFMLMLMTWKTIRLFDKTRYVALVPGTFFSFLYIPYLGFSKKEKLYTLDDVPAKELGFWQSKPLTIKAKGDTAAPRFIKSKAREWSDAIIYAAVAAYIIRTFLMEFYNIPTSSMEGTLMVGDFLAVSKVSYGPKFPQTPVAVPFVHHTIPLTDYTKSYWDKLQVAHFRFRGLHGVERNDAVVFNYPDGDTVILERQNESYYAVMRHLKAELLRMGDYYPGKEYDVAKQEYQIVARPVDKRENYVKRCVAIAGDTLQIKNAVLYINNKKAYQPPNLQLRYYVWFDQYDISEKNRKTLDINEEDHGYSPYKMNCAIYHLNKEQAAKIAAFPNIRAVEPAIQSDTVYEEDMFPHDKRFRWNVDNYGPIVIPKKGMTVALNDSTIQLYKRIIKNYEYNDLQIENGKIFINGQPADSYTFQMNYYWLMGDNRHNSADSRCWGFVPEDHIVGKPVFAWLSLDKFKKRGEGKIRWKRMFRKIK
ncbi:MAG: signal peptidase I [Lentimicrobiaceae bacterium]|nr:signal peptidase I [Lentimicrobiaceae bacterium]